MIKRNKENHQASKSDKPASFKRGRSSSAHSVARTRSRRDDESDSDDSPYRSRKGFDKSKDSDDRPYRSRKGFDPSKDSDDRPYRSRKGFDQSKDSDDRPYRSRKGFDPSKDSSDRPYRSRKGFDQSKDSSDRPYRSRKGFDQSKDSSDRPYRSRKGFDQSKDSSDRPYRSRKGFDPSKAYDEQPTPRRAAKTGKETVRLNKYIANAGICSRREADTLIAAGSVKVNGEIVTQMGYQVKPGDVVSYGGETLRGEPKRYFLLNKPKGFITTLDDPQERKTVMMLMDGACTERIYPVGRLDRNTTGLLLFTNDGEMAKKLTHPSTRVYKIYQVELNQAVTREHMKQMLEGIELEDGMIQVDDVQYVEGANDRRIVGVQLHSGKNRIVRRIFEHFGYEVHKLDRVVFAGLTKKDLPRGRYRELTPQEVSFLKMI